MTVSYLSCPTCGLSFRVQALDLGTERCPRCLAKAGRVTKLLVSEVPHVVSRRVSGSRLDGASQPPSATGDAAPEPAV